MFKKIMVLMCSLVILVGGVLSTSFDSNASSSVKFNVDYAEPSQSDSQGYMNVLLYTGSGYKVETYFWSCYAVKGGVQSPAEMHINFTSSTSIEFVPYVYGADGVWYSLGMIDGSNSLYYELFNSNSARYTRNTGYEIRGYTIHGNGYVERYELGQVSFVVNYSSGESESLLQEVIDSISDLIAQNVVDSSSLISKLNEILNSTEDISSKLVQIYQTEYNNYYENSKIRLLLIQYFPTLSEKLDLFILEQQESNTWLEKIYNFFAEKDEKDKEAATQQGNQSTADIDNMITDDSAGFVDSLGGLTSSMSYTGTDCSWTFPTVKLPAISGVMDEVTLVESQEIDFSYWVNSIPSEILLLVQSVCTVALIVFCFKELYGSISYVLTLKGGGNSE